ncbi:hypothetical protein O6H91_13G096300 [Diphasiastrum complanatum]|uniref:Uncharacterized protein n=1 Tax=Diphasiastrum complanatum TaxID=34168 RepID=A0ACC2BXN9_DIPCM|nr:hypothetical protein O6H91_13G096300 [Diphasiastrum complanatum]
MAKPLVPAHSLSFLLLLLLLLVLAYKGPFPGVQAQLSKQVSIDPEAQKTNKFRQREATDDSLHHPLPDEGAMTNTQCPRHVELRWQTEVSSSIYGTPIISDINNDGKLEIVVPSFVHYLEVLEGADGEKLSGWPAYHQSIIHSSPILYDIDEDGSREILLANYNGEILLFRASGYILTEKMIVPRLRVRKDWYAGLNLDHVDRSHPDIHDEDLVIKSATNSSHVDSETGMVTQNDTRGTGNTLLEPVNGTHEIASNVNASVCEGDQCNTLNTGVSQESPAVPEQIQHQNVLSGSVTNSKNPNVSEVVNDSTNFSRVDDELKIEGISSGLEMAAARLNEGQTANLAPPRKNNQRRLQSLNEINGDNSQPLVGGEGRTLKQEHASETQEGTGLKNVTVENEQDGLEADAEASFDIFRDEQENMEGLSDEYAYDYDDFVDESLWGDESWVEGLHETEEDYVHIDSHILCTPVIADIDRDGVDEMIVAASFFFDQHATELGGLEVNKYIGGSIVVFNLKTKQVKWSTHLDLSTDFGTYRAYIYSAPTVADLDGDGYLDIIVGTSFGFVYTLHHDGSTRENFPLQMGEVQAQVIVADINDDGELEIVTVDTRGNVAAWTRNGKEIWEVHVKSLISQAPTIGDVDGNGLTDVVVPTASGNIYVLNGVDGAHVRPYPFRTHGRVMSPILLVDLNKRGAETKGLSLVTTSFDGYLYLIDGPTACADVVDIGETSYSMVLAENVDGGDDLDLVVTTMNGNVYCFQTPAPHHPLKSWPTQAQGKNVFTSRLNREGVFILPASRTFRDETGDSFWVQFKIIDNNGGGISGLHAPYQTSVTLLIPGNYPSDKRLVQHKNYTLPGVQKVQLSCPSVRTSGTVVVEMTDKHGLHFSDEFSLTFHMHFYRLLKWLVFLPLLGTAGMLVLLQPQTDAPLPSFSIGSHEL